MEFNRCDAAMDSSRRGSAGPGGFPGRFSVEGECFAFRPRPPPRVAVQDIAAHHVQVPGHHELVLDGILNPLDLQFLAPNGPAKDLFDHLVRAILDSRLGQFRKVFRLRNAVLSFEGAFNG